jgi:hypothetical protein
MGEMAPHAKKVGRVIALGISPGFVGNLRGTTRRI